MTCSARIDQYRMDVDLKPGTPNTSAIRLWASIREGTAVAGTATGVIRAVTATVTATVTAARCIDNLLFFCFATFKCRTPEGAQHHIDHK